MNIPTLDEVRARVDAALGKSGPRLMRNPGDTVALKARIASEPMIAEGFAGLMKQADSLLTAPLLERTMTGRRLLSVSRECLSRVLALGYAWRLTADSRYADRAVAEMRQVGRFHDWNPSHFLDTAEMSLAVAIGLDWFREAITPAVRAELAAALTEKGLDAGDAEPGWWVTALNNWSQVCHCGMVAAALALMEEDPGRAARVVHRALVNVPKAMAVYDPDGGYPEGPGYWGYGTMFNIMLIDTLESVLGTDFGLSAMPGFDKTGVYIQAVTGPTREPFNYADGWGGKHASMALYWFACRFGTPVDSGWAETVIDLWRRGAASNPRMALDLLWLPPAKPAPGRLPLDWQDRGVVPVAVHRNRWGDTRALFVGVKAGSPAHNHGQMDSGSFVLDADGVRWAVDLGAEDYHRIESRGLNLWERGQASDRWKIFRLSNHSHNTLVIDGALQLAEGDCPIKRFSADPDTPFTRVDLTPVYQGQAARVIRTVALPGREAVVIHDRLTGLKPGSWVRWGMVTRAEVALNGAQACLKQGGQVLRLEAFGVGAACWQIIDTATPHAEFDSPNPGTRMIAIEVAAPESGELALEVRLIPGSAPERAEAWWSGHQPPPG